MLRATGEVVVAAAVGGSDDGLMLACFSFPRFYAQLLSNLVEQWTVEAL